MRAIMLEEPEHLLEDRRRRGADLFDEMWDGVLHMVPAPSSGHQGLGTRLVAILLDLAEARGFRVFYETRLYRRDAPADDYRIPDLMVVRPEHVSARGVESGADVVIEILSPGDETYEKVGFY